MAEFSITGDGPEWGVFSLETASGLPAIVRTRLGNQQLKAFAKTNVLARVRCVLPKNAIAQNGMPTSTVELDEFEDDLVAELGKGSPPTYVLVVVTGEGTRDFYFAAPDGGQVLVTALRAIERQRSFEVRPGRMDAHKERLLESFSPA